MTVGIYSCCLKFAVLSHHMHVVEHLTSAKIGLYADRDWADIVASNPAPSLMSKLLQAVPEADQPARVQDALVQASLHGNLDIIKQVFLTVYRIPILLVASNRLPHHVSLHARLYGRSVSRSGQLTCIGCGVLVRVCCATSLGIDCRRRQEGTAHATRRRCSAGSLRSPMCVSTYTYIVRSTVQQLLARQVRRSISRALSSCSAGRDRLLPTRSTRGWLHYTHPRTLHVGNSAL